MKKFGLVGLGRMGLNAALLASEKNLKVIGIETNASNLKKAHENHIEAYDDLKMLLTKLEKPRVVFTLLPPNEITQSVLRKLIDLLESGDVLVDAGNSYYKDTLIVAQLAQAKGIEFADVGNNNGTESARVGACYTVGASESTYKKIEYVLHALAAKDGIIHTGKVGSGHFIKAVHNAIEYGMLQAIAEGFEIVKNGPFENVDLAKLAKVWNQGSVIRCWILDLLHEGLKENPQLSNYQDDMDATGQGLWTVLSSLEQQTPCPVLALSVIMRNRSKQKVSFSGQVVNCLREKFGGHIVSKKDK